MYSVHQLSVPFAVLLTVVHGQILACPSNRTVSVEWGETGAPISWADPTPPSPLYTKTFQTHSQGTFPLGTSVVTYQYSDQSSQETISCSFTVTVVAVDVEPPVISNCPESQIEIEHEVGIKTIPGNWMEPTATDNSGQVILVERTFPPDQPLYIGDRRTFQVTYRFEDFSGNQAHCVFNIRYVPVDTTPPTVKNCPNLIIETVPLDSLGTTVILNSPDVTDNSGQWSLRIEPDITNNYFTVGATHLKYIYTDASGNQATCDVNVQVIRQDITPPVITYCPESMTYGVHADVGQTFVNWDTPTAEDDSGTVIVKADTDPGIFSIGTTLTVTYELCDPSHNHVSCTFSISVIEDEEPPTITGCPKEGIFSVLQPDETITNVTWTEPFAKDDTVLKYPLQNYYPGEEFELGITTVEYVFEDSAGNFAVCKFDVEVRSLVENNAGGGDNTVAIIVIIGVTIVLIIAAIVIACTFVHFEQLKDKTPVLEPSSPTLNDGVDRSYTALVTSKRPLPSIKDPNRQTTDGPENQNGKKEGTDDNEYLSPAQ
ncbi:Hyalin [Holothuria leucospilota]|uniref:Hyalin n=1 Tax=Holothuria leucospilota TaxID=206669 RepID=A0A9Q1CM93_HOLLE|nr:Hyalin [Holothuria leucospilota]